MKPVKQVDHVDLVKRLAEAIKKRTAPVPAVPGLSEQQRVAIEQDRSLFYSMLRRGGM